MNKGAAGELHDVTKALVSTLKKAAEPHEYRVVSSVSTFWGGRREKGLKTPQTGLSRPHRTNAPNEDWKL